MNNIVLMVSILRRELSETAISFLNKEGISLTLGRYGRGTATSDIAKMFIPDREKCVLFSTMPYSISKRVMEDLLIQCGHRRSGFYYTNYKRWRSFCFKISYGEK